MTARQKEEAVRRLDLAWEKIGAVTVLLGQIASQLDQVRKLVKP